MVSCGCNKRYITLVWAVMECLFFSGILFGWSWLSVTLRRDMYFIDLCNVTIPEVKGAVSKFEPVNNSANITTKILRTNGRHIRRKVVCRKRKPTTTTIAPEFHQYDPPYNDTQFFCDEQEERLELMYTIIIIIRNALILPLGFFLDKYGTTRTRLISVLSFVIGTLMMTFSSSSYPSNWLVIPAFILLSFAGLAILITNLQVANLFVAKRYTVMATMIGAYFSSSLILNCVKETHDFGLGIQTSFMFMTIGVVPILVSTIAFLPKTRIPWPLPAFYGKRKKSESCRSNIRDTKNREDMAAFKNVACSSLFIWSVVWYSIHSLREITYDSNIRLILVKYGSDKEDVNIYYMRLISLLRIVALPIAPLIGMLVDCKKLSSYYPPRIQQMHNILLVVFLTFLVALLNNILPTIPHLDLQIAGFVLQVIERVGVLVCLCAFLTHVHFPIEHFGKYICFHFIVASITCLLRFPFERFVATISQGDPFYINLLLLILLLISCGHPINIWYHSRLGLIQDASTSEYDGITGNEQLVNESFEVNQNPI